LGVRTRHAVPGQRKDGVVRWLVIYDVVQVAGCLFILAAFVAGLGGRLQQSSYAYLALNAMGSTVLTATAVIGREWGFILLEGVWAAVSIVSLARKARGSPVGASS